MSKLKGLTNAAFWSVIGFLIAQGLSYYQFTRTLTTTNQIEQIHLLRDLIAEFWGKDSDSAFKGIRTGIERCERLYSGDLGLASTPPSQGKYDFDQINRYLGLFDQMGFYQSQRALTLPQIDHSFGAVIIETYEYKELRLYVDDMQRREPYAFVDFQALARKLEALPKNQVITDKAKSACAAH